MTIIEAIMNALRELFREKEEVEEKVETPEPVLTCSTEEPEGGNDRDVWIRYREVEI